MRFPSIILTAAVVGSLFWPSFAADDEFFDKVKTGPYRKIGSILGQVAELSNDGALGVNTALQDAFMFKDGNKVLVEIIFTKGTDGAAAISEIESLGFEKLACNANVCSGYAPNAMLTTISERDDVNFLKPTPRPVKSVGSVTSQGDRAMNTDQVKDIYGLTGAGQKVGVLSDSFNCLDGYDTDINTGDLPDNVNILLDLPGCLPADDPIDEGRAMAQLIYDVAPEVSLAFYNAFEGPVKFAEGIKALAEAGCTVIVDDITYFTQPFFQDDVVTQAVEAVAAQGIPYFSSAGNSAREAWHTDAGFVDSGLPFTDDMGRTGQLHDFGGGDTVQNFDLTAEVEYGLVFQWNEPFASNPGTNSAGSASDLDIYLVDEDDNVVNTFGGSDNNVEGDAVEFFGFTPATSGTYGLKIVLHSGTAPSYMKWIAFNGGASMENVEYAVLSSTLVHHHNAANGAGVGASNWEEAPPDTNPAVQQGSSSAGGTPIFFDYEGNRLTKRIVRQQPRFTGPDGGITTFFPPDDCCNFFGTSAAAPHVAAVAALMLQQEDLLQENPNLYPERIYTILEQTARDMDDTATEGFDVGFDFGTGYGFVDGLAALDVLRTPTPETPLPTFNYKLENSYFFAKKVGREPTPEEGAGLARLTQIFYRRLIAALYGLSYDDVDVSVTMMDPFSIDGSVIEARFDMVVTFNPLSKYPTSAQVGSDIESIRTDIYVKQFVNVAEPAGSIFST